MRRPPTWIPPFIALSVIWGSSFLFIKVSDRALSPVEVALGRVAIGALALFALLGATGDRLPRGARVWAHLAVVAAIANVLPFSLFAYGETKISSVLAGLWNGTTPLMTLLVVLVALREERPTRERAAGLVLGFLGVVCLLGPWSGLGGGALRGNLACLGAAALYGVSFPYMRRFLTPLGLSGPSLATGQLLCASIELALVIPWLGGRPGSITTAVALSLISLGALGTGLAYVLSYRLLGLAGATTTSTVTYVIPVFATVLGIAVLGERLRWNEPLGAAIVLAGVAVSQRQAARREAGRRRPAAVTAGHGPLRPRASAGRGEFREGGAAPAPRRARR